MQEPSNYMLGLIIEVSHLKSETTNKCLNILEWATEMVEENKDGSLPSAATK